MARSDLLISLLKAGSSGNLNQFRDVAEVLIAEERSKKHSVLADRLEKSLSSSNGTIAFRKSFQKSGNAQSPGSELVYDITPSRKLSEIVLPENVFQPISELIEEQNRKDLLYSHGTSPRHRMILAGPPGNGKTCLAEAVAYELACPLYVVRYDSLVGSYLGETGARLKQLFELVRTTPCVLFFDEFDAIGKERGDTHETGEIKRVVSTLLMQVDRLPNHVVVIAASNHPELLDRAVWRRFQLRLELPLPKYKDIATFISMRVQGMDFKSAFPSAKIAKALRGASFAEIEEFVLDVHRRYVLSLPNASLTSIVNGCIKQWKNHYQLIEDGGDGNGQTSTTISRTET